MDGPVTDPTILNPNPHGLTFPYPQQGTTVRPPGEGCLVCVHQGYCPAVYWFKRYGFRDLDEHMGRACASWTIDPAKEVRTHNANDIAEVNYIFVQGIGSEANRDGITSQITGGDR